MCYHVLTLTGSWFSDLCLRTGHCGGSNVVRPSGWEAEVTTLDGRVGNYYLSISANSGKQGVDEVVLSGSLPALGVVSTVLLCVGSIPPLRS